MLSALCQSPSCVKDLLFHWYHAHEVCMRVNEEIPLTRVLALSSFDTHSNCHKARLFGYELGTAQ